MAEAAAPSGLQIHPMEQFEVNPIFGGEHFGMFTITNAALWMILAVAAVAFVFAYGSRQRAVVPGRLQSLGEVTYGFVRNMVEDTAGKDAMAFFPFVMTLFVFILFSNSLALLPYSFSPTSHIAVTAVLAVAVFVIVLGTGFAKHGLRFFRLFWVAEAPTLALRLILAVIELISFFVRPVSHSIRLGGNIMAGHAVLKVFAGFAGVLGSALFGVGALIAILPISAFYALEVLVAFVQAYVFAILTCVYLHDAYHPGH